MNSLERFLDSVARSRGVNPIRAMNHLQDVGVISDNCITPGDVAESECAKAIQEVQKHLNKLVDFRGWAP